MFFYLINLPSPIGLKYKMDVVMLYESSSSPILYPGYYFSEAIANPHYILAQCQATVAGIYQQYNK